MPRPHPPLARAAYAATLSLALLGSACERAPQPSASSAPQALSHQSARAPYTLTLGAEWEALEPATINTDADLAAQTRDERVFLMVVPTALAPQPGVAPIALSALRDSALALMASNTPEFTILSDTPAQLSGAPAHITRARGRVGAHNYLYAITYARHEAWGYQLVLLTPEQDTQQLERALRALHAGWRWRDEGLP